MTRPQPLSPSDAESRTGPSETTAGSDRLLEQTGILREELRGRMTRQAERVQQTATDMQTEAQRRVTGVQEQADRLRTQLAFRREKRDPIRYRLSVSCARLLSWFAASLPGRLRVGIAYLIGAVVFWGNRAFRDNVADNLRHVLGPDASDARIRATTRSISRNGILNIVDLLIARHLTTRQILTAVDLSPELRGHLARAQQERRGVIVMTAHLGSFDVMGQALVAYGYPTTALTGRTTFRLFFDGVMYLRRACGGTVVEPTPSGVRAIYRALHRSELVGIVCDRDFFQNGRPVIFFGEETALPPGPVRIARDTGAMVLPCFARRIGLRHEVRCLEPFDVPRTSDVEADIELGMRRMVAALEEAIGSEPEQWSIFQRVWPERPRVSES